MRLTLATTRLDSFWCPADHIGTAGARDGNSGRLSVKARCGDVVKQGKDGKSVLRETLAAVVHQGLQVQRVKVKLAPVTGHGGL
jgi:hypothetical protein